MAEIGRNSRIAFYRGKDDADDGAQIFNNPYTQGSPSWRAWTRGFKESRREHAAHIRVAALELDFAP